jgi:hypothetical protein
MAGLVPAIYVLDTGKVRRYWESKTLLGKQDMDARDICVKTRFAL